MVDYDWIGNNLWRGRAKASRATRAWLAGMLLCRACRAARQPFRRLYIRHLYI